MNRFSKLTISLALLCLTAASQAVTLDWRAGTGNTGADFTANSGLMILAGAPPANITLGLRATERQVGTITPVGNVYNVDAGPQIGNPARAWWNFDIFVGFDANIAALSALTLEITSIGGSPAAAPAFNLLDPGIRGAIDCHTAGCVNGNPVNPDAGLADLGPGFDGAPVQNPTNFYNASQNPVFGWFAAFDYNDIAIYDFRLTATDVQGNMVSTAMRVNVGGADVPEPTTSALLGLGLMGFIRARRR